MEASLVLDTRNDLMVVNAARVSLNKKSEYLRSHVANYKDCAVVNGECINENHYFYELAERDAKLIKFLASQNPPHFTPFCHSPLYFGFSWTEREELEWYRQCYRAGFEVCYPNIEVERNSLYRVYVKGSLFSFAKMLYSFPQANKEVIVKAMQESFPVSSEALLPENFREKLSFSAGTRALELSPAFLYQQSELDPSLYKVLTATLHIKVPIFVARQIRTSRYGICYSDMYVEGESFDFNEVSRRYVDEEPEFYRVKEWRVREKGKVKQGSTGEAPRDYSKGLRHIELKNLRESLLDYDWMMVREIAPEQARALLPQSMYTEFYMTASLHRWAQFLELRSGEHVQEETQEIARMAQGALEAAYPEWGAYYRFLRS